MINPEYELRPSEAFDSFVRKYTEICAGVQKKLVGQTSEQKPFYHAAYLASRGLSDGTDDFEIPKAQLRKLGMDGNSLLDDLNALLEEDQHLKKCCRDAEALAYYLDDFMGLEAWLAITLEQSKFKAQFEGNLSELKKKTYECRFTRIAYTHLYNFSSSVMTSKIGAFRIEHIPDGQISALLGENTPTSFLNPVGVGNFFIVSEQVDTNSDETGWIIEAHQQADKLVGVLQYFKDGVVYVDYSIPHYKPEWVNRLWKGGISFIGKPHLFSYRKGAHTYHLDRAEYEQLRKWAHVYNLPDMSILLDDYRNPVRQSILRAGEYFKESHTRSSAVAKLPDLAIALESLFVPNEKSEFSFRIAQSVAQIVGKTANERKQIFKTARDLYDRRSQLLHGTYNVDDYYEGRFVTDDEIEIWSSLIRRAILHVLALYVQGWNNRGNLLKAIVEAALDEATAQRLRSEADYNAYINSTINI